jgi:CheY-like chemotaxis protein
MAEDAVSNGKEAVALYRQGSYALILMDCQMLEMDGYGAAQGIRELEKGKGVRTPLIAITARTMQDELRR